VPTGWKCTTLLAMFEEHKTTHNPIVQYMSRHAQLRTLDHHFTMVNLPLNCSNKVQAHR
jgi:hypothetical protein